MLGFLNAANKFKPCIIVKSELVMMSPRSLLFFSKLLLQGGADLTMLEATEVCSTGAGTVPTCAHPVPARVLYSRSQGRMCSGPAEMTAAFAATFGASALTTELSQLSNNHFHSLTSF